MNSELITEEEKRDFVIFLEEMATKIETVHTEVYEAIVAKHAEVCKVQVKDCVKHFAIITLDLIEDIMSTREAQKKAQQN